MRKSTCYTRFYNTTGPPFKSICDNPLAMELTRKLCCCTVGQGWLDPDVLAVIDEKDAPLSCDVCPIQGTGTIHHLHPYCGLHTLFIDKLSPPEK